MSYGRNPYYIWSDREYLHINGDAIPAKMINAFLYKVLLTNRREELKQRLKEGKQEWLKQISFLNEYGELLDSPIFLPQDDPQVITYKKILENKEDDLLKELMGL